MEVYKSKTGFVKCKVDNVIYKSENIYLGIYDKLENYEDCSEEDYNEFIKSQEKANEEHIENGN